MPDLDILARAPAPGWRRPYRLAVGSAASPQELASAAIQSLAHSLRSGGGLPALDSLADVVSRFLSGQLPLADALHHLRSIEQATGGDRHTKVAARATARLLVELGQGGSSIAEPRLAVAERFCWAMVDHHLFGRVRPELVGSRFPDHASAFAWEEGCKEALRPGLKKVASALARDPMAARLHAPRTAAGRRRSTADLLNESLT